MTDITKGNWSVYKDLYKSDNPRAHTVIESDDGDLYMEIEGGTEADVKAIQAIPELVKAVKLTNDLQCNFPEWWFRGDPSEEPSPCQIVKEAINKLKRSYK